MFGPTGRFIAKTDGNNSIMVYRKSPVGWMVERKLLTSHPRDIVWGAKGKTLVWTEDTGRLAIWRKDRITRITGSNIHDSRHDVYDYALSPDESELAVARLDGLQLIRLGAMTSKHFALGYPVTSVIFDRKGNLYGAGRTLLWLPFRGTAIRHAGPVNGFVRGLVVHPDGGRLAVLEDDCRLSIYQLPIGKTPKTVWRSKGLPAAVAWSPNGRLLAMVLAANEKAGEPSSLNRVEVINDATWTKAASIPLWSWAAGGPEFDGTGSTLCVIVDDRSYFWSTLSWKRVDPPSLPPGYQPIFVNATRRPKQSRP